MNNTVNSIVHEPRIMLKSIGPILQMEPRKIDEKSNFDITFSNLNDWYYCTLYNGREANSETCDFYVCKLKNTFNMDQICADVHLRYIIKISKEIQ